MVKDMLRAAKERRWSRTLAALVIGAFFGSLFLVSIETGVLGGILFACLIWVLESKEVTRIQKIQKPWRDE